MSTIYLLKYNNYFNRIAKKEATISGYLINEYLLGTISNVNFNPNDGVDTELLIGKGDWADGTIPDYLISYNSDSDFSRWFVIEASRTRAGQYKLTLHRDVVIDYYNDVINAPCYIEKATVQSTSPFIYNNEDIKFNQIKQSETLLKDETNCPWLVGYFARTNGGSTTTISGSFASSLPADITLAGDISTWQYYNYTQNYSFVSANVNHVEFFTMSGGSSSQCKQNVLDLTTASKTMTGLGYIWDSGVTIASNIPGDTTRRNNFLSNLYNNTLSYLGTLNTYVLTDKGGSGTHASIMRSLVNKVIKYVSGAEDKYVRVELIEDTASLGLQSVAVSSNAYQAFETIKNGTPGLSGTGNVNAYKYNGTLGRMKLRLVDIPSPQISVNIPANRYHCADAPYDIFAIPYGNISFVNPSITVSKDISMNILNALVEANPSVIYDVQLLPYCPVRNIIQGNTLSLNNDTKLYSLVHDTNNVNYSVVLNVSAATGTFDIPLATPVTITEPKVQNQCDMYRLCSPNYNGVFEFNAVKNGGIASFNVDYTYKPYSPYIHLNPDFNNLYGSDFNDSRGLICQGDFSLAMITDQWKQYEISNKNYANIFNRQIENLEITQKAQRTSEIANLITGSVTGAVSGALTGGMLGGTVGGIAGAATGAAASLAGGIVDLNISDKLRAENISYTTDMYNYNLDNIKALPDSLAKVGAYTANNKLYPFLEYYSCTAEEKQAFRDKLKYNGMTVMAIGNINDYIQYTPANERQYVKGKIIRIENLAEDYHLLHQIANEINMGVFF